VDLGEQKAGTVSFDWDGTTDAGGPAGAGPFTVTAIARDAKQAVVQTTPLVWAPVTTVAISNGEPVLTLPGLGEVKSSAVRAIG
jgi:flagellar basal-body rod modification protein FlgD